MCSSKSLLLLQKCSWYISFQKQSMLHLIVPLDMILVFCCHWISLLSQGISLYSLPQRESWMIHCAVEQFMNGNWKWRQEHRRISQMKWLQNCWIDITMLVLGSKQPLPTKAKLIPEVGRNRGINLKYISLFPLVRNSFTNNSISSH